MQLPESRLSPNLKNKNIHSEKIYYIFSNKVFLTFWDNGTFKRNLKKMKKIDYKKIFYISENGTF